MAPSTLTLSLNHVIIGVGTPVAVHVRLIDWPALPVTGEGGPTIIGGVLVVTVYRDKPVS